MSVDADEYLRSNDLNSSMLYDFGYHSFAASRNTFKGGLANQNLKRIEANEADLADKKKFLGCTCGVRQ